MSNRCRRALFALCGLVCGAVCGFPAVTAAQDAIADHVTVNSAICVLYPTCNVSSGGHALKVDPLKKDSPYGVAKQAFLHDLFRGDKALLCGSLLDCKGYRADGDRVSCVGVDLHDGRNLQRDAVKPLDLARLERAASRRVDFYKVADEMKVNVCEFTERFGHGGGFRSQSKTWQLRNALTVTVQRPPQSVFGRECSIAGVSGFDQPGQCGDIYISTKALECYKYGVLQKFMPFKDYNSPEREEIARLGESLYRTAPTLGMVMGRGGDCRERAANVKFHDSAALLRAVVDDGASGREISSPTTPSRAQFAGAAPR